MAGDLRLMAVHAHADDETITMGGLFATLHDRGVRTSLITCTDGKLATIYADDMPEETTRPILADVRKDEMRRAAAILGIDEINFLDYADSGMAGSETNSLPEAFWMQNLDQVTERIVAHIRRFRPHVVVTYDAFGGYGHPDHIQTHRATTLAVEAARHPAMFKNSGAAWPVAKFYHTALPRSVADEWADRAKTGSIPNMFGNTPLEEIDMLVPDDWVTTRVDVRDGVTRMREALRAHRSQMPADFPYLVLPEDLHREILGHESFRLVTSTVPTSLPETDVFAGVTPD